MSANIGIVSRNWQKTMSCKNVTSLPLWKPWAMSRMTMTIMTTLRIIKRHWTSRWKRNCKILLDRPLTFPKNPCIWKSAPNWDKDRPRQGVMMMSSKCWRPSRLSTSSARSREVWWKILWKTSVVVMSTRSLPFTSISKSIVSAPCGWVRQ